MCCYSLTTLCVLGPRESDHDGLVRPRSLASQLTGVRWRWRAGLDGFDIGNRYRVLYTCSFVCAVRIFVEMSRASGFLRWPQSQLLKRRMRLKCILSPISSLEVLHAAGKKEANEPLQSWTRRQYMTSVSKNGVMLCANCSVSKHSR